MCELPNLTHLNVPTSAACIPDIVNAMKQRNLRRIYFGIFSDWINNDHISAVLRCEKIQSLYVFNNMRSITDSAFALDSKGLSECKELRELELINTRITAAGLEFISRAPMLETLSIRSCEVNDEGIAHLQKCTRLNSLSMIRIGKYH